MKCKKGLTLIVYCLPSVTRNHKDTDAQGTLPSLSAKFQTSVISKSKEDTFNRRLVGATFPPGVAARWPIPAVQIPGKWRPRDYAGHAETLQKKKSHLLVFNANATNWEE